MPPAKRQGPLRSFLNATPCSKTRSKFSKAVPCKKPLFKGSGWRSISDLSRKGPLGQIIDVFRTTTRGLFTLLHIPVAPEADPLEVGVNEFAKNFFVTPDKTGNVIFVTFSNGDPALAAEVVNALVKTYIEKRALLFRDVQSATMNEQVESLKNKLAKAQKEYADFKTKNDISDYAVQRNILLHQRAQISDDLQAANRSISEAAARIDVTEIRWRRSHLIRCVITTA